MEVSGTAAASPTSFRVVIAAINLRHDGCQFDGQLFGQWELVFGYPLGSLVAVQKPLSIRFALEIVPPK